MKVKDVMTKEVVFATVPGSRTDLLRLLVKHGITGAPVLRKADGRLAGLVTRFDVLDSPEEEQLALLMKKDCPVISPNADLREAARTMDSAKTSHLPVVHSGKLIGLITPTDLLKVIMTAKNLTPISDQMLSPCAPVHESLPLNVAIEILRICKVTALPVLDDSATMSGLVTDRDLVTLTAIVRRRTLSDLGIGEDEETSKKGGIRNVIRIFYETGKLRLPKLSVKDVMVKKPLAIHPRTSVSEAARLMVEKDFSQIPVVDEGTRLAGLIYDKDLIHVLISDRSLA